MNTFFSNQLRYIYLLLKYSYHLAINIDTIVDACLTVFIFATKLTPKFKVHGGTSSENLALQNIQVKEQLK